MFDTLKQHINDFAKFSIPFIDMHHYIDPEISSIFCLTWYDKTKLNI